MALPLWEECSWNKDVVLDYPGECEHVVFPKDDEINKKIYLHYGKIYKIPCDVMILGQNDTLNAFSDGMDAIYTLAGPQLEDELASLAPLETGDSVVTNGYMLPCTWLVHAVGPKYDPRYLTAAAHALFTAYHSSLIHAASKNAKSIVINCLYLTDKKYPRFDAAHIALRTVRKFLNHSIGDCFERVMFCVPTQDDFEIYSALLSGYFPRNYSEVEGQSNLLPADCGDEWGDLIVADRILKVSAGPKPIAPRKSLDNEEIVALGNEYKTGIYI
jgi:O-acetyl-ADP-ribose deacetylase (regulator of RNase III)